MTKSSINRGGHYSRKWIQGGRYVPELVKYYVSQLIPTSSEDDFSPAYSFTFGIIDSEQNTLCILIYFVGEIHLCGYLE